MNDVVSQDITLINRKTMRLTGITKIESLNPLEFMLVSTLGIICIKGNDLEMKAFDVDKGNITITGTIDSFMYHEKATVKKNKGFIQKLFK